MAIGRTSARARGALLVLGALLLLLGHLECSNGVAVVMRQKRQVPVILSPIMEYPPNTQFTKNKVPVFDSPYSSSSHQYNGPNGFARYETFTDPYRSDNLRRAMFLISTTAASAGYVDPDSVTEPTSPPRSRYPSPSHYNYDTQGSYYSRRTEAEEPSGPSIEPTTTTTGRLYHQEYPTYERPQSQSRPSYMHTRQEPPVPVPEATTTRTPTIQPSNERPTLELRKSNTSPIVSPVVLSSIQDSNLFEEDSEELSDEIPTRGDNRMNYRRRISETRQRHDWGLNRNQMNQQTKPVSKRFDGQVVTEVLEVRAENNLVGANANPRGATGGGVEAAPRRNPYIAAYWQQQSQKRGSEPEPESEEVTSTRPTSTTASTRPVQRWPSTPSPGSVAQGGRDQTSQSQSRIIDLEADLYDRNRNGQSVLATQSRSQTKSADDSPLPRQSYAQRTLAPGTPRFEPNYPTLFEKETADRAAVPNQVLVTNGFF